MSPYRLRVISKGRRLTENEVDADARMHAVVGNLCGLGDDTVAFAPPSTQCGWMEPGKVGGGVLFCLHCAPTLPTAFHIQVFHGSYFGTLDCVKCGRRLDTDSR